MRRAGKCAALALAALLCCLAGCAKAPPQTKSGGGDGRLRIVCTLFAQYDFARIIAGDRAQVTLLLPPGAESHAYEPTPADIVLLAQSDVVFYTGALLEPWTDKLFASTESKTEAVDISAGIKLLYMEDHVDGDHGDADPHIWLDPQNAKVMARNIEAELGRVDPEGKEYYAGNAAGLCEQLDGLDESLKKIVAGATRKRIVFGGRIAFAYLAGRYGLECISPYDGCGEEAEPSAKRVAEIMDVVASEGIPVVYYEEMAQPLVAKAIADQTGAKLLMLHSCHNTSKQEREDGTTFIELMKSNIDNIKEGLY